MDETEKKRQFAIQKYQDNCITITECIEELMYTVTNKEFTAHTSYWGNPPWKRRKKHENA